MAKEKYVIAFFPKDFSQQKANVEAPKEQITAARINAHLCNPHHITSNALQVD